VSWAISVEIQSARSPSRRSLDIDYLVRIDRDYFMRIDCALEKRAASNFASTMAIQISLTWIIVRLIWRLFCVFYYPEPGCTLAEN
jgi:hypothetical protein